MKWLFAESCREKLKQEEDEVKNKDKKESKNNNKEKIFDSHREHIIIVVDRENISKDADIERLEKHITNISNILHSSQNESDRNIQLTTIKIAGYCSTVKKDVDIVVRSNRKDAVDHYISYYVGKLESSVKNIKKIYVVTRDNFAGCLQDFCNIIQHVADVDDLMDMLKV